MERQLFFAMYLLVSGCIEIEPEHKQVLTPPIRVVSVDEVFEGDQYPDLHISLREANDNWCLLSITKSSLKQKKPNPNSKPAHLPTEIDCSDGENTYSAHSGIHDAYVVADSTPQPDGSYQLDVFARMQTEDKDNPAELKAIISITAVIALSNSELQP